MQTRSCAPLFRSDATEHVSRIKPHITQPREEPRSVARARVCGFSAIFSVTGPPPRTVERLNGVGEKNKKKKMLYRHKPRARIIIITATGSAVWDFRNRFFVLTFFFFVFYLFYFFFFHTHSRRGRARLRGAPCTTRRTSPVGKINF